MASGAKNQLPLVNDLGAPTLRDGSVGRWDGKESFFPMVLTLVATRKLRFVKRRPFGPLFGYKSRFLTFSGFKTPHAHFTSRIDWFYAAKHDASSPGSSGVEPRRFPVWAVLVDLAHLAKVDSRAQTTP